MVANDALRVVIEAADPASEVARNCLSAYFTLLTERVPGVLPTHVPDPDPDAALYRPPLGVFLLATSDGLPVGCVALKSVDARTGEVKRLWVAPAARGLGLARRLMRAIEDRARGQGLARLQLDTNSALTEAVRLYESDGWHPIAPYTSFPADRWFGKTL